MAKFLSYDGIKEFLNKIIGSSDYEKPDYLLGIKDGKIVKTYNPYVYTVYKFVGSSSGSSTVVIDGSNITVPANGTVEGVCYDITGITTNNLKEIYINGNFTAKLSSSDGSNDTVEKVDLTYRNGYEVDMEYMFYQYSALQSLSITGCAITSAFHMCHGCGKLADTDFDGVDFSKCTSTWAMFNRCYVLKSVDVSDWDMSSVETMQAMFYECEDLEYVDVSKWNTSACTIMQGLFRYCYSLKEVDVNNFDTSNVTTMYNMFRQCRSLTTLDVSNWDTGNVTTMGQFVNKCYALTELNLGNNWDMLNVTDVGEIFTSDELLTTIIGTVKNLRISLDCSSCPLTRESALVLINGLSNEPAEETPTLTLSSTTKALLTDDDIAIATDKGWTIN